MPQTFVFAGRAVDRSSAAAFIEAVAGNAAGLGLEVDHTANKFVARFESDAEDLVIEFNGKLAFEGALKPSEDKPDREIRAAASMFGPNCHLLAAFEFFNDEGEALLEHGDVDGLRNYLEVVEESLPVKAEDAVGEPIGELETQWYTHCRIVTNDDGVELLVKPESRGRISDIEWKALRHQIGQLRGLNGATLREDDCGFQLRIAGDTTLDDHKRLAISTSFMIDDAIVNTSESASNN